MYLETVVVMWKRQGSFCSCMCWLFIGRPRLCFAVDQVLPLLNRHDSSQTYFAGGTILQVALFYRLQFTLFSLVYDLSLERKKWFVAV